MKKKSLSLPDPTKAFLNSNAVLYDGPGDSAAGAHKFLGHKRFVVQAQEMGESEEFIHNVCRWVECSEKVTIGFRSA